MNRIFYIHSNILAICCYQTVKEAIEQKDNVYVILNRNCVWPFFTDKVKLFDFAKIFDGEDKQRVALHSLKAIKDYIRYRRYINHLEKVVNRIVAEEDFIFYMPSMALDMTLAFAYNKNCKGYYYVDEGSLAYLPQNIINAEFSKNIKNLVKRLLRIEDHCHYEIKPTFKGTISITTDAFLWNKEYEKIVNPVDECVSVLKSRLPVFDDVIVTARLIEDVDTITKSLDFAVERILSNKPNSRIGIKLHPNAVTYNKEKASEVVEFINKKYGDNIAIISPEVSIEAISLICHSNLYSLFVLSSLILYGLLFGCSDGYLISNEKGATRIEQIKTVEDYYKKINKVNF
ncbi:MAG: hypothetical protein J6U22_03060 [Bacteroidaceae bacterium]|nr:hypothetical protein [Bacteroidaceae bacterium]